jgi:hypothetical protein
VKRGSRDPQPPAGRRARPRGLSVTPSRRSRGRTLRDGGRANPKIGAQPRMRQHPAERQQSRVIDNRWSGGGFDGDFVAEGFELVDVGAFAAFGVDARGVEV